MDGFDFLFSGLCSNKSDVAWLCTFIIISLDYTAYMVNRFLFFALFSLFTAVSQALNIDFVVWCRRNIQMYCSMHRYSLISLTFFLGFLRIPLNNFRTISSKDLSQ